MNVISLILIIQLVEHADPIILVIIFMKLILKVAAGHHDSSINIYVTLFGEKGSYVIYSQCISRGDYPSTQADQELKHLSYIGCNILDLCHLK